MQADAPPGTRPGEDFDVLKVELTAQTDGSTMFSPHGLVFAFRTDAHKDWVEGVGGALKKARGQLSGDRPGIVFVETPAAMKPGNRAGLASLKGVVAEQFRNSTRLSAVVIAFTEWHEQPGATGAAVAQYHFEGNPTARHPASVSFYASPETKHEWQRTGRNAPCPCGSGRKFKKCCLT